MPTPTGNLPGTAPKSSHLAVAGFSGLPSAMAVAYNKTLERTLYENYHAACRDRRPGASAWTRANHDFTYPPLLQCEKKRIRPVAAMISDFLVGPSILMYHSIADKPGDPFAVTPDAFREQISWLSAQGFKVVPLAFLLQSIQTRNYGSLRKKVVITFDDGYSDFVTHALPILLEFGAPATVFLVTDMLGERAAWNGPGEQAPLMSAMEARYVKSEGISLGSHTATHAKLTLLDREAILRQLEDSREALTRLGEDFLAFSYPWGQASRQIEDTVKESGYACAVAVGGQMRLPAVDPYLLPRLTMRGDVDLRRFRSLVTRTNAETEVRKRCRSLLKRMRIPRRGLN